MCYINIRFNKILWLFLPKMWKFSFYIVSLSILVCSCAQVVPLTGGKRDTIAPKILSSSPANKSLNFSGDNIIIKFDEFVQLKDLSNQLIISPSLKTKPNVQGIGKSVVINFNKEDLEKNTTYRLFFGNAIVDMHEGNPLKNYEFIFSTGNQLDTTIQEGEIADALFKEPETDMLVGLYPFMNFSDSTIYKKEPMYYAKTNTTGKFKFAFLPDTNFRLVAFNDKNKNLMYDAELEKLAFKKEKLKPGQDSILTLYSFYEAPRKTFIKKTQLLGPGKALIVFNKAVSPQISALNAVSIALTHKNTKTDSLLIYYWPNVDTVRLKINDDQNLFSDTVQIIVAGSAKKNVKFPITTNTKNQLLKVDTRLQLNFPQVIDSILSQPKKIFIYEKQDSLKTPLPFKYKFLDQVTLEIETNFNADKEYVLKADSGIFKSKIGFVNDSLKTTFKLQSPSSLGQIKLNLLFNKKQSYVLQLINSANKVAAQTSVDFALSESNNKSVLFKNVAPGNYKLRIVFDDDNNKEWSTGHFLKQLQPERVEIFSKELKVISDWEIEEDVVIKK